MRVYKHLSFAEGIDCTLGEFKKDFAPHLKKLNEAEIKEAHRIATKGNGLSKRTTKGKKANASKS